MPKLIAGEYMGAYGLTEPNAGSDSGGTETTAVLDGDEWVLNGRKCFCTNANHAGVFIVTAVTDKSSGPKGISAFVVPRETPGFSPREGREEARHARFRLGQPRLRGCTHPARSPARAPRARASRPS